MLAEAESGTEPVFLNYKNNKKKQTRMTAMEQKSDGQPICLRVFHTKKVRFVFEFLII